MKKIYLTTLIFFLFLGCPALIIADSIENQSNSIATNLGLYGGYPEDIAINYSNDYVYIANFAPNGLFFSTDLGENWTGLPSTVDFGSGKAVEVDQSTGYIYAIVGDNFLMSTDYGVNFTDISQNSTGLGISMALAAANGNVLVGLYDGSVIYSTDNGNIFNRSEIESDSTINYITASPAEDTFYATVEDDSGKSTLYISQDAGATWTDLNVHNNGVATDSRFYRVGVDPQDENHLVITSEISGYLAYQSFDAGATWTAINNNGQEMIGRYVEWNGAGRMYMNNYYTDDAQADPIVWTYMDNITPASSCYFDILTADRIGNHVIYTDSSLGVARSIDDGVTWTDQINGVTSVKAFAVAQADDKNVVWVGTRGGLARTANFTSENPTWQYPIVPNQNFSNWMGLLIDPTDANRVIAGASSHIFYTGNAQAEEPTWTEAFIPVIDERMQIKQIISDSDDINHLHSVFLYDNLTGIDTGAILESTDGGLNWTDTGFPQTGAVAIALSNDDILYAGITGDGAETGIYKYDSNIWEKTTSEFDDLDVTSILADPVDENVLYVTADAYPSGGGLYKTIDKGVTWSQLSVDENVNHLDTLTLQTSGSVSTIYVAGQDGDTLNGVVYKTSDGGETFGLLYTGLKQENFYTLLYDGLIVGNDRGLYEIKSKAKLKFKVENYKGKKIKVNQGEQIKLTGSLIDLTTNKLLKNKKISLYRKINSKQWKVHKRLTTNKKGTFSKIITINRMGSYKVKWTPKKKSAEEYAPVNSRIIKINF